MPITDIELKQKEDFAWSQHREAKIQGSASAAEWYAGYAHAIAAVRELELRHQEIQPQPEVLK